MNNRLFKLIASLLLIITLVNFIFPTVFVYGMDEETRNRFPQEEEESKGSDDLLEGILFDGTVRPKQDMEPAPVSITNQVLMFLPNVFISVGSALAFALDYIFNFFVPERVGDYPGTDPGDYMNNPVYVKRFSLDKLFFDDIELLNANFFKYSENESNINNIIKKNVAKWYVIMSGVALVLLLVVMIYLAINMALMYSGLRTPEKHANIKSAMTNVLVSLALVFLLPIILSVIANFNDFFIGIFSKFRVSLMNANGENNFEYVIRSLRFNSKGLDYAMYNLSYILLIVVYARFVMVYLKRFYTLGFLTIISPLIAVTYSVDKLKDDKSQVLGKFYKEYFFAYFLQVLHGFMFIIYISSLGAVAAASPMMGLFLFSMYGRVEKIIKGVFDSRDLMVIRSSEELLKGGSFR